jgi:O-antigen/teichoic acid export membrane protein
VSAPTRDLQGAILRGVAWNAAYQIVTSVVQFGAMLIVVRIVPPQEYGQWAVALGILQFLNTVSIASFLSHALQLREGEEPNWTLHWHAGNVLHAVLFLLCVGVAAGLCVSRHYTGVSVLLCIASIGVLTNTPAQLRMVMLQRSLDFRRMRMITTISSLLGSGCIVLGAMAGFGARAMIFGGNVLVSVPFIIDLLVIERWRPIGRWFDWPDLRAYRDSLVFGASRVGAVALATSRGVLNSALLPATLGLGAMGLMNRAEGLFAMSAGRVLGLVSETVYPVLPQISEDEGRFVRVARGYSLLMSALVLAAVGLFAVSGKDLSRILYGQRWAAADSVLLPGSLIGLATALATVGNQILLARGRLRDVFILDLAPRLLLIPAFVGVVGFGWSMVAFHWGVAIPLVLGACCSLFWSDLRILGQSVSSALAAPAVAAFGAFCGAVAIGWVVMQTDPAVRCAIQIPGFVFVWLLILRGVFPTALQEMAGLLPGKVTIFQLLRLDARRVA